MEFASLSTVRRLAAAAANTDDLQFTNWNSISSTASINAASINIAGLVIGALCNETASAPLHWHGPHSSIAQSVELRERLVLNLLKCAVHDFHRQSNTHLFFGFYSSTGAIRAFHAFKDKAFTNFLIECGRLAVENPVDRISEWNAFLESGGRSDPSVVLANEAPCSGVINFRVSPALELVSERLTREMAISFNGLSAHVFDEAIPLLESMQRKEGTRAVGSKVRRFGVGTNPVTWKQRTVRIPKETHAILIGFCARVFGLYGWLSHVFVQWARGKIASSQIGDSQAFGIVARYFSPYSWMALSAQTGVK